MTEYTELKRLAELLHGAEWQLVDGDGFDADNRFVTSQRRIDDNKVAFAEINYGHPEAGMGEPFQSEQVAAGEFIAAANPAAVLALIAENERLKTLRSVTERDLAQELEVWRHGPSCWNCGDTGDVHDMVGEWLGQCDCNAAKLIDISSERDQLRAEVAGLKTGYEAYERVNAELKAEVEKLRKLGPSKEIIWCACGDGYPVNSYGAGFMAANGDVCENCDAANGRVEPHLDTPDELKALRQALTDIFNHVEGNTECLVRDLVNWGTPRINPNDFYDECEAIKEIANAALGQGEQS